MFDKFLKLQGRLDLINAHISQRRGTVGAGSNGAVTFVHREAGDVEEDAEERTEMELDDLDMEDDEDDEEDEDDGGMDGMDDDEGEFDDDGY